MLRGQDEGPLAGLPQLHRHSPRIPGDIPVAGLHDLGPRAPQALHCSSDHRVVGKHELPAQQAGVVSTGGRRVGGKGVQATW